MTRAKISEYSATANDNTDVNGINIAEGCPPSSMNNMGREIMAALKRFQVGSDGDGVTVGGNLVVSGSTSVNTFNVDVISEKTSAAGVTVDGVLLKDSGVVTGAGTVSAPVYSTTGDLNTGIFFPAADTIAFAEGGAEAMRIDSDGHVGIGTTDPVSPLHVSRDISTAYNAGNTITAPEALRIANPNTGSGIAATILFNAVGGGGGNGLATISAISTGTGSNALGFGTRDAGGTVEERARITSDGYLRMASGSGGIQFNGDTAAANALDDYEEGTWTPAYSTSGGSFTYDAATQGQYTKIGNVVTVYFRIYISPGATVGTGDVSITGLPFTDSISSGSGGGSIGDCRLWGGDTPDTLTVVGTSIFPYYRTSANGANTRVQASDMDTSGNLIDGQLTYITS